MQIDSDEFLKRLMISDASFLTANEKSLLQKNLDSPDTLALMSITDICNVVGRSITKAKWNGSKTRSKAELALKLIERLGIKSEFWGSEKYPAMLLEMKDPPYAIFYRGNLECLNLPCVSVVGTRRATNCARSASFDFGKQACDDGKVVVSGLAFGVDIASHRGALKGSLGKTCAVLPSGIDTIVPSSHTKTAVKIIEQGGVILSEYTPGTPAEAFRFVQRNRLIAALSPATVVIQAPAGSGAMITASLALDYNRYVFFHEVCFDSESQPLKKESERLLMQKVESKLMKESVMRGKLMNCPERFVEDGAPVIKNYGEYRDYLMSGFDAIHIKNDNGQQELFDE